MTLFRHTFVPAVFLAERNFHLDKAAGLCSVHGSDDPFNVAAQCGPLLITDNHEGDFAAPQVLLILFLSVVSNNSKPAASAAAISSPFVSLSHTRSIAFTTT
jgi:hypothetical protein